MKGRPGAPFDRKGGFYFTCAVMIAGGALAWYFVLLPLARLLGLHP